MFFSPRMTHLPGPGDTSHTHADRCSSAQMITLDHRASTIKREIDAAVRAERSLNRTNGHRVSRTVSPMSSQWACGTSMSHTQPLPQLPSQRSRSRGNIAASSEVAGKRLGPQRDLYQMYKIAQGPKTPVSTLKPIPKRRVPAKVPPAGYEGGLAVPGERGLQGCRYTKTEQKKLPSEVMYQALAGAALARGTQVKFSVNRVSTVMQVVSPSVLEEAYYDENVPSTFFRLSQKTGFSKKRLSEIFSKWSEVTRNEDMGLSQFSAWMKSIGFPERVVIEQLFFAFDEDGGGSISFAECASGLSYTLARDIRLPQFELSAESCPGFAVLAFRFLDRDRSGILKKMGLCKLLIAALKMSARAASEMSASLLQFTSNEQPGFVQAVHSYPELWRFLRQLLQLQNQPRGSREFVQGKQKAMRHFDNALNGRDEGEAPDTDLFDYESLDCILPVWMAEEPIAEPKRVTQLPRGIEEFQHREVVE